MVVVITQAAFGGVSRRRDDRAAGSGDVVDLDWRARQAGRELAEDGFSFEISRFDLEIKPRSGVRIGIGPRGK